MIYAFFCWYRKVKRITRRTVLGAGLVAGSVLAYHGGVVCSANFHTVARGQFYRSAQLNTDQFVSAINTYGIKSILNLRGPNPQSAWYIDEVAVARQRGVLHYDVEVSAQEALTEAQVGAILDILRGAPKPILVHCKSGADRTGLVSALYRYALQGTSAAEAEAELSVRYGHFPYLSSKTVAMDATFQRYRRTH